jgi:hypothetical protein
MTEPHKFRCLARIDRPYESVRACLHGLFVVRTDPELNRMHAIYDQHDIAGLPDSTRVTMGLEEVTGRGSRHVDSAEIYASALSSFETKIEVECHCTSQPAVWADKESRDVAETRVQALLQSLVERIRRAVHRSSPTRELRCPAKVASALATSPEASAALPES